MKFKFLEAIKNPAGDGTIDLSTDETLVAQIQAHINEQVVLAQQTEKDKLYPTIQALKAKVESLTAPATPPAPATQPTQPPATPPATMDAQVLEALKAIMSGNASGAAPAPAPQPGDATQQMSKADFAEMLATAINKVVPQVLQPLVDDIAAIKKSDVEAHRAKVLAENSGKLIEELVTGTTIEEINASVATAKELFTRYSVPQTPPAATPAQPQTQPTPAPAPIPAPGTIPSPAPQPGGMAQEVKELSPAEYAAKREQLMSSLKNRV